MISNHYAMTYRHEHAWAVLGVIMAAGVLIRHFFNLRHKGRVEWKYPVAGVALLLALAVAIAPKAPVARGRGCAIRRRSSRRCSRSSTQRCVSCHAGQPTQPGFATAPAGVMLHDAGADPPERGQDLPAVGAAEGHADRRTSPT